MKKKLLYLTAFPPNRMSAGQNYSRHTLEQLSEIFDVDLLYFDYKNQDIDGEDNYLSIEKIQVSKICKLFNSIILFFLNPIITNRFNIIKAFKLHKIIKKYDIIYLDFSQVFLYGLIAFKKKKIFMVHDVISQKCSREKSLFGKILYIQAFITEKIIFSLPNIYVFCVSEKDKNLLKGYYKIKAEVVKHFIEKKILLLNYNNIMIENYFCFYGAWHREENTEGLIWFIKEVLPILSIKINFYIIGSGINDNLKKKLNNFKNFKIIGYQDDPYIIIAKSKGLIAPLFRGAGVKAKVVESLACGTPVLGTEITFEGINFNDQKAIFVCSHPEDYINYINLLLSITKLEKINIRDKFLKFYINNESITTKISDLI